MAALGDLAVDPSFGKCDMDMEEVLDKAPNCSICLEPVIQGASRSTAQLACSHHFHLDCIGSAFNAKGAMECPNCRRVEDGNWLMLGGSQSADDALYEVPYDFDDEEYLGMPVDALDTEMREYMEAGRDISYTTHPYHPHGVICEFCEQHYCDDNPCPHIIQCPYFFSNISQSGSTDNHFGSSISSMEAEAYAEAVAELYHEYRGPAAFSAPPSSTPRHAPPPEMHTSSSSTDSNYVYYFSSTPATGWQGGSTWGEGDPPTSSWGSGWQQDRRQETTHTTTFVQSSTMITTYGPQAPPPAATSFPPPPRFPPAPLTFPTRSQNESAAPPQGHSPPMLSPRTPLQTTPLFGNRHHSQPFSEAPPPPPENYASLRLAPESNPHVNGEGVHTNSRPLTYAGVLGRREQTSRRGVNAPQERLAGQPWRPVSDMQTSSGGVSGRHSSLPHYHSSQAGHNMVCPYLANTGPARSSQGLVPPPFHPDASRMASQQGLSASGQLEDGRNNRGGFENRHARQVVRGEGAQGAESLIAMLELDDGMWLQDRNNMLLCSFCSDQARPRFQTERRFVNRDALSQHMRAVHGVHLDRFSTRN